MIQPSAACTQPATAPRVPAVIIDAERAAPNRSSCRQYRAEAQQNGLTASISALADDAYAIADISHRSKFP
jgi:hypothetical protein